MKSPCIICGESEPVCIDFHHINPIDKEFTIGKHRGKSRESLSKEISKCVCLCANCHRKVHAGLIDLHDYIINKSPS
jgi:predicted HNH restriction endonuclease